MSADPGTGWALRRGGARWPAMSYRTSVRSPGAQDEDRRGRPLREPQMQAQGQVEQRRAATRRGGGGEPPRSKVRSARRGRSRGLTARRAPPTAGARVELAEWNRCPGARPRGARRPAAGRPAASARAGRRRAPGASTPAARRSPPPSSGPTSRAAPRQLGDDALDIGGVVVQPGDPHDFAPRARAVSSQAERVGGWPRPRKPRQEMWRPAPGIEVPAMHEQAAAASRVALGALERTSSRGSGGCIGERRGW